MVTALALAGVGLFVIGFVVGIKVDDYLRNKWSNDNAS